RMTPSGSTRKAARCATPSLGSRMPSSPARSRLMSASIGKGRFFKSAWWLRHAWCTHSESMLAPRICVSRSWNSLFSLANPAISVGQTKVKSFGQKKYSFHLPAKSRSVRVLNAFLGSFSVLTVAVIENEGNFSPIPNIASSPMNKLKSKSGTSWRPAGALGTSAEHVNRDAAHLKSGRKFLAQAHRVNSGFVQVSDRFAFHTNQVMMHFLIGFNTQRAVGQPYFPQHAAFDKSAKVLVNRG